MIENKYTIVIDIALKFIQFGEVAAMVTNPIAKNIINYAFKNFTGHTEYLAKKSKSKNFCMMLINDTIKVIPLTIHIPLKKVSQSISKRLIKDTLKIINQSIKKDFGNKKPKILIATKFIANENSLVSAIRNAIKISKNRSINK